MIDLKKLAHELNTQDNRITANPLFCVEQKRRVYGLGHEYTDNFIHQWKDDPGYFWETEKEALKALEEGGYGEENYDDYIDKVGYYEYWDFVTAHLTEKAAQRYINENKHNLNEPRIFVSSQHRCHEFNDVVEYLKTEGEKNGSEA
jgi:hypothetical protein